MLASPSLIHKLKWAVPAVVFTWCFLYLTTSRSTYSEVVRTFRDERKLFLSDFLEHDVEGVPFDGAPIAEMCAGREWKKDLILSCEPTPEGIGSVRNGHLACIRVAIEMGAGLIFPNIVKRSDHNLAKPIPKAKGPIRGESLSYFFDWEHLNRSLATHCPQMRTWSSINDLYDVPGVLTAVKVKLGDLTVDVANGTTSVLAHPERLGAQLKAYVQANDDGRRRPLRVQLASAPLFWFPTAHDTPSFAASFGGLLRVRADARRLAGEALFELRKRYGIYYDPRGRRAGSSPAEGFLGVRIRSERDVWAKKWPSYDEQAPYFLNLVTQFHERFPVVFIAQGMHPRNATSFAARCADFNVTAVRKEDLFAGRPELQEALKKLSWDQRALVDYEVMLRAGMIAGIAQSSFAWNLAARRRSVFDGDAAGFSSPSPTTTTTTNSGDDTGAEELAGTTQMLSGKIVYHDRYSVIFGAKMGAAQEKDAEGMRLTIYP